MYTNISRTLCCFSCAGVAGNKFERKLNIIQTQTAIASENKQPEALQLLYKRQIIEARDLK